jgi:integrase
MGELRALRWADVDFAKHTVFVRQNRVRSRLSKPKSGKVRSVPLIDQAAAALDALSRRKHFTETTDLVFATEVGGYFDDGDLRQRFYGALKRAGLGHKRLEDPPLRFHDLRHTFGTLAVQVWSLVDVQSYMGHANITTTMIYAHHVPKRDAAAALSELISKESPSPGCDAAQAASPL